MARQYAIIAFDKHYIRDAGDHLEGVLDLDHATVFPTKKEAKATFATSVFKGYMEVRLLSELRKEFEEWKAGGMVSFRVPKDNKLPKDKE